MIFRKPIASIQRLLAGGMRRNRVVDEETIQGGDGAIVRGSEEETFDREGLKNVLRHIGHDIQTLAQSGEGEFLSIGERLQSFWETASGISDRGRQAAELMSGDEITESIGRIQDMAGRMNRYLEKSSRRLERNFTTIQTLLDSIRRTERPLHGLQRIVTGLQTLGVSTRIESALIAQSHQNFVFLADEVNLQSEKIKNRSEDILEKMDALSIDIAHTLDKLNALREKHRGSGRTILDNLNGSLSMLTEKQNTASSIARGISEQSDALSGSMGQVVMSMQFHDITRQQIEHVKSALDELTDQEKDEIVGKGCALQAAQVRNSKNELVSAVDDLQRNLRGIADNVRGTIDDMNRLTGIQRNQYTPFYGVMEKDMNSAASQMAEYKDAEHNLAETINSFAQTLEGMKDFSKDIGIIGRSIKFVALNATIQAARIGRKGAAMDVVAQGIRQLSGQATEETAAISHTLKEIREAAHSLHRNTATTMSGEQNGLDDFSRNLGLVLDGVCTQSEKAVQLLETMDATGRGLADDVETLADGISIHNRMNSKLGRAETELERIADRFSEAAGARGIEIDDDQLENLTSRYTMDSERSVHHGVVKEPGHPPGTHPATDEISGQAPDGELDDNIELFGDESEAPLTESADDPPPQIDLFTYEMNESPARKNENGFELFEETDSEKNNIEPTEEDEDDLGDNVELF